MKVCLVQDKICKALLFCTNALLKYILNQTAAKLHPNKDNKYKSNFKNHYYHALLNHVVKIVFSAMVYFTRYSEYT